MPYKIPYAKLSENQRFDKVINQRKHFLNTIKLIAYRAETALSNNLQNILYFLLVLCITLVYKGFQFQQVDIP